MVGYDPDFIGVHIPLPQFRPNLVGDVLRNDRLRDGLYADYPHYTVVMNARLRSPIFAALNINQALVRSVDRSDDWATDSRIGDAFQLDNAYYASNRWDKGHMAARAGAAWGRSDPEALIASDETFYYSNAVLQADNLNRDEWRGLETWVRTFDDDVNNRVSVLSGPIYRGDSRFVTPGGLPPARVPSAFFKVVYFRHRDDAPGAFSVRAFIMTQDAETLRTRSGWELENLRRYQVSVRQIETLTGLDFPEQTGRANPIFFSPSDAALDLNVTRFPEINEVDAPRDIVDPGQVRVPLADPDPGVRILAAMVNPRGPEAENEWVSLANLSAEAVTVDGWTLTDIHGREHRLDGAIGPGEALRVQPLLPMRLANSKDGSLALFDAGGARVHRVAYTEDQARKEGAPVVFFTPGRFDVMGGR